MYFDEDLLLDIRLNSLEKFVKKFVITEATYTHNGNKKKLNFDINRFQKFKDKIIYIVVDKQPENILQLEKGDTKEKVGEKLILNGMARDYYQRECLSEGLKEAKDDDLILISDLDEIPNLESVNLDNIKNKILIFEQKMFYYKLNLCVDSFNWFGTKACKNKYLISPQWLRNIKTKKYPFWRLDILFSSTKYNDLNFIKDGGWHFTNIKSPKEIHYKLSNFLHHLEYEHSGITEEELRNIIKDKKIYYDHEVDKSSSKWKPSVKLERANLSDLPEYLRKNKEKLTEWFDF